MATYTLVIEGAGLGCAYTLGCNMIRAGNVEEARAIARKDYPGPDSCIPWEYATLVEIIERLPIGEWSNEERRKEELRREANKTEYKRIKDRFGGGA